MPVIRMYNTCITSYSTLDMSNRCTWEVGWMHAPEKLQNQVESTAAHGHSLSPPLHGSSAATVSSWCNFTHNYLYTVGGFLAACLVPGTGPRSCRLAQDGSHSYTTFCEAVSWRPAALRYHVTGAHSIQWLTSTQRNHALTGKQAS
jgi:hypothetical protein